jgi:hypothetical protein
VDRHQETLDELDARGLDLDAYQTVYEELFTLPKRDLPTPEPWRVNRQAQWWELTMGKPVPALSTVND